MRVGPRGPTVAAAVTLSWLAGQIGTQGIDAFSLLLVTNELGAVFASSRLVNEGQSFSEVSKTWPKEP